MLKRIQNELAASCESVEPRECSIDVSSRWEMVPVSSVSYCLRHSRENLYRSVTACYT